MDLWHTIHKIPEAGMYVHLRTVTWKILSTRADGGRYEGASAVVNASIFALIVLNVAATILGTVDSVQQGLGPVLQGFETISVLIFTVEYVLRVWSCVENDQYSGAVIGRLQFAGSFYALIDLAAIAPFYLSFGLDLRFARVLRLLRLFRLIKAARYFSALRLFGEVVQKKKEEIAVSLTLLGMLMVVTSSLVYFAERAAQPEVFGSIPKAMWWSVVTITTVGYGNAAPVTVPGQLLGGVVALLGTGMGALPAGFLASGFSEALESNSGKGVAEERSEEGQSSSLPGKPVPGEAVRYCPHCGSNLAHITGSHPDGGAARGASSKAKAGEAIGTATAQTRKESRS